MTFRIFKDDEVVLETRYIGDLMDWIEKHDEEYTVKEIDIRSETKWEER